MRLGYELGYVSNLIKPSDLRRPDHSPSQPLSDLERLYIRTFGIPDTVKQQQARMPVPKLAKNGFYSIFGIWGQLLAAYFFLFSSHKPSFSKWQKNPRTELKPFLTILGTTMRA